MTEPLTRQDVERAVREAAFWMQSLTARDADRVSAALLAMAECEGCSGTGEVSEQGCSPQNIGMESCPDCRGTGLNQSALARGLKALKGKEGT